MVQFQNAWFKRGIQLVILIIGYLLNPLGQMESREEIITTWGFSYNFLEYEQLRFRFNKFMRNHIDGTMLIQPCLPFLIQISNLSLKGCANFFKSIKKADIGMLCQIFNLITKCVTGLKCLAIPSHTS